MTLQRENLPKPWRQDFQKFRTKIHQSLPDAHIYYLSMKFSPSRAKFENPCAGPIELIAADCAKAKNCTFVDVNTPMLSTTGQPRPELFRDDLLHMRPEGYAIWTKRARTRCSADERRGLTSGSTNQVHR